MRNTKTRIAKLEGRYPKEVIVFRFAGFGRNPVLPPEEEAILRAEEERLIRETKTGFVFIGFSKRSPGSAYRPKDNSSETAPANMTP